MTTQEEMTIRELAARKLGDQMKRVYAGKPSSKGFVPNTISGSSLVSKTAEKIAAELIDAHDAHEAGRMPAFTGSFWGTHGDMASEYLFGDEHGLDVDGTEFWVTTDLEDGWKVSNHPDGVKVIDERVFICEQKNPISVWTEDKKIIALRQAAFYLAQMWHRVRTEESKHHFLPTRQIRIVINGKGWLFDADPNYLRACEPFFWANGLLPGGILRSISGRPPGGVYTLAFSDEDLEAHRLQMVEKAMHIKLAVIKRDLDYARQWDSDHADEFGEKITVAPDETTRIISLIQESLDLKKSMEVADVRRKAIRDALEPIAKERGGVLDESGFTVKVERTRSAGKWDKKNAEALGVLSEIYVEGKEGTRVLIDGPDPEAGK